MKTGPKHREDKVLIKYLQSKVKRLERKNSLEHFSGHSSGYKANICLDLMCQYVCNDSEDEYRCYKNITLQEFHTYLETLLRNESCNMEI